MIRVKKQEKIKVFQFQQKQIVELTFALTETGITLLNKVNAKTAKNIHILENLDRVKLLVDQIVVAPVKF